MLPRVQPADAAAHGTQWQQTVRHGRASLNHPQLAAVVDIGVQDGWPYVAYDPRDGSHASPNASARARACRALEAAAD